MELELQDAIQEGERRRGWFWECVSPTCDYYEEDNNDYEPEYEY